MHLETTAAFFAVLLATCASCASQEHPRIFVCEDDLPGLRARASDSQPNALGVVPSAVWAEILAQADRFVQAPPYSYSVDLPGREGGPSKPWSYTLSDAAPPRHDDYSHYPPWTAMFQERSDSITTRLMYLMTAYLVTEDAKYFEPSKQIVMHMSAWSGIWTDPSYSGGVPCLDTGHAATWVAIFYDWCYDSLSEDERTTVREALIEKAILPIDGYIDSVSPYHNYTAVVANGLCMGGIALLGEDYRAQGWIDHAIARSLLNFDAQGKDGGAMEGPGYGTYATDNFADMIWALNTSGIQSRLTDHNYIKTLPRYCISLLDPNSRQQPTFGDGGPTRGFGRLMLSLAAAGSTDAAWYCQKIGLFEEKSPRLFLALDPDRVKPQQPAYNPSAAFVDIGYAILRDGYEPGAAFMALKSGPPEQAIGHNHLDHNSFVINYAGQWIGWDPGYRSYFDPPDRRYSTSTLGHSSIVLDMDEKYLASQEVHIPGHDQARVQGGRIAEFVAGGAYDYVMGSAAATYNSDALTVLDKFDRQVVFAKPNLFFIRDTLAAPREHTYSFLLHLPPGAEFAITPDGAQGIGQQCLLQTRVMSPDGIAMSAASYPGAESRGPYLAATTGMSKQTTITTVLVPRRHSQLIANPGFESGMAGWSPRSVEGVLQNHVIDADTKHGGNSSARIDDSGYYYSRHFSVPPGTKISAKWWAKCTAREGASSIFYYWKGGTSFANKVGSSANVDEWTQYTLEDVVPAGTEEVCIALQFSGKGQCWYDDVEMTSDVEIPSSEPAQITPLAEGAEGAVAVVDGVTHVLLCGSAGVQREFAAAGAQFTMDGELAVISLHSDGPQAFLLRGSLLQMDGKPIKLDEGEWRVQRD